MTEAHLHPYTLRYLELAIADIREIKEFNKRFSKKYQAEVLAKLKRSCACLTTTPYIFPEYEHLPDFRKLVVDDYLVFYKVSEQPRQVSVYRILHSRRDVIKALKSD